LTYSSSIEQVVTLLLNAGYKRLPVPLTLAGLKFDVAAVLIGTDRSSDLVIVEDTVESTPKNIQIRIETIARAMDVLDSKRPITAVLVGPRPSTTELDAMSKVSRILPIGAASVTDQNEVLSNWLAALMPLRLPPTGNRLADPLAELSGQVDPKDIVISELLASAPFGTAEVAKSFHKIIEQRLTPPKNRKPV
jgi:hypothetical protein